MKKQIADKCSSFRIIIIICCISLAACLSCRKHAGGDTGNHPIIYTDVNPDLVIEPNTTYSLDLDNDGAYDFIFNASFVPVKCDTRPPDIGEVDGILVTIPTGSNHGIIFKLNPNYSACLDSLTLIDNAGQWSYVTSLGVTMYGLSTCISTYYSFGDWYVSGSNQNKFMGLKLVKGSAAYYGWVRLYLDTSLRKLIVRDYAYNSTPGESILAGQNR